MQTDRLPQRRPVQRDKQPRPGGDRWSVTGEFGRVEFDSNGSHLKYRDVSGEVTDAGGKRISDRIAEYAKLGDDDAVFAVLADLYRTELAGGAR